MATYYFSANGNDSTGDGSSGNPWLDPSAHSPLPAAGDSFEVDATQITLSGSIVPAGSFTLNGLDPSESTLISNGNGHIIDYSGVSGSGYTVTATNIGLYCQINSGNTPIHTKGNANISCTNCWLYGDEDVFVQNSTSDSANTITLTTCLVQSNWDIFAVTHATVTMTGGALLSVATQQVNQWQARCIYHAATGSSWTDVDIVAIGVGSCNVDAVTNGGNPTNFTFTNCTITALLVGTGLSTPTFNSVSVNGGTFTMVGCSWNTALQTTSNGGKIVGSSLNPTFPAGGGGGGGLIRVG